MNIQQTLRQASTALAGSSPSASLDAQVLLTHVLDCNSAHLAAWPEKALNEEQTAQFQQLIQRRLQGAPVAHLTGQREFWSLSFSVDNSTLIPRPETETLVEYILEKFNHRKNLKLLDMGTGTGAIAISLAKEKNSWSIYASDISESALALASHNNDHHQTGITLLKSDWFSNITQNNFDIIVSNPPYIAADDPHLQQGDVRFEPQSALTSGKTGMDAIEHICRHAKDFLSENGCLIMEHGYNQKQQVADCFSKNGFKEIEQKQDLSGHTRMTSGKKL
jgi:release factor glutamine methyltransferase